MSKQEIFHMIDDAKKLNFVAYLVWGGEPLIRPDIIEILQHARDRNLYTSIITNGTFLPEKAKNIARLVDFTFVSLDYHSDYHDILRGRKGTFERAVEGIKKLRDAGGRVAINCVLSKQNMDSARMMIQLARSIGVKVSFDPMEVFSGCNEEFALSENELSKVFSEIYHFDKQGNFVLNSREYLRHLINNIEYSCVQPAIFLVVSEDGKIKPFWCKKTKDTLGDLRKQTLMEVIHSSAFKNFTEISKGCSLCNNSSTVETSVYYSTRRFFKNYYKWNNPYLKFISDYAL